MPARRREATVGAGVGANALVGGSNRSVALQPLSVQGQVGLNAAAGIGALELHLRAITVGQQFATPSRRRERDVAPLDRPRLTPETIASPSARRSRTRRGPLARRAIAGGGHDGPVGGEALMATAAGTRATGPRCVALVGPFQSGKTTLLEAILARTGAIPRQGTVEAGNTVGDASKEARHHRMSVELTVATTNFMGDAYTFLDCPGSVEFVHDMRAVLPAIDAAVVVCEMDEKKIPQLQLILRELEERKIPRILFVNKIDKADAGVHDVLKLLQPASRTKLILRQIPTFSGDIISGFVDLALERAFVYKEHAPSEVVPLEGDAADLEKTARFSMLETLADHDDELMEQLLEDIQPPRDKVFDDLTRELREGLVCPVLMGTAARANGVLRLLKALRHESPGIAETAKRLGVKGGQRCGRLCAQDAEHRAWRQNVGGADARGAGRRRHDFLDRRRRSRPRRRRLQARRPDHRKARPGRASAKPSPSPSSKKPRPATR